MVTPTISYINFLHIPPDPWYLKLNNNNTVICITRIQKTLRSSHWSLTDVTVTGVIGRLWDCSRFWLHCPVWSETARQQDTADQRCCRLASEFSSCKIGLMWSNFLVSIVTIGCLHRTVDCCSNLDGCLWTHAQASLLSRWLMMIWSAGCCCIVVNVIFSYCTICSWEW